MNLDVVTYGHNHAAPFLRAFREGLRCHGIEPRHLAKGPVPLADLVVFWGHRQQTIIDKQIFNGCDYLVMERGYFGDRMGTWTSCGFNGLNGNAEFHNADSPPDRWLPHAKRLKPWRTDAGHYILIMGQVAGDASIQDVDINEWYRYAYAEAKSAFNLPIYFRPHPLSRYEAPFPNINLLSGDLQTSIANAHLVVTYNSNSGVDAILAGVPTVAYDKGSMARGVAMHETESVTVMPDRQQWANNLAYCQWTMNEIKDGITWDHLRQRYA